MGGTKKSRRRDLSDSDDSIEESLDDALLKHTSRRTFKHGSELGKHQEDPSPRANATWSASPNSDQIILFGGEFFDGKICGFYNDLYVFEIAENAWYKVATSFGPGPRSSHQAVWGPDGKLYIFGGEFGTSKETRFLHYRDFWTLDPRTWTWESLNIGSLPPARSGHRMTTFADLIVMFGGFIDTNGNTVYLDDLWLYSFTSKSWTKVDWLNTLLPRPTARSAFQLATFEEGVLIYGGYCQVKAKNGIPKGHVLNDIWALKIDPADLTLMRWEKRKTGSSAPLPRSGCASLCICNDLIVFGGVFDEDSGDEFIQGTCTNELYSYSFKTGKWSAVEYALIDSSSQDLSGHQICPRFNTMITLARNGSAYIYGGIWEIGDVQYTLDDLYCFDPTQGKLMQILKKPSVNLSDWKERVEAERREMMLSEEDSDERSTSQSDSSDEDSDDEDTDAFDAFDDKDDGSPAILKVHRTLKDYFDSTSDFWLALARKENSIASDKDQRKLAFLLAKANWDENYIVSSVEKL